MCIIDLHQSRAVPNCLRQFFCLRGKRSNRCHKLYDDLRAPERLKILKFKCAANTNEQIQEFSHTPIN